MKTLPARIQERLERIYGVEAPSIDAFVQSSDRPREVLELQVLEDAMELRLHLPREAMDAGSALSLDQVCQVAEGVSHFLYLAERARRELPTTHLELELQAEVDKFLLLSTATSRAGQHQLDEELSGHRLRERLFDNVSFLDAEGTENGDRYRVANRMAARFALKLERALAAGAERLSIRRVLRRFFGAGQREKIEMVLAA